MGKGPPQGMYAIEKTIQPKEAPMDREYPTRTPDDQFRSSRDQFETAIGFLYSPEAAQMSHSELEDRIDRDGRELMRQLLQDHLDLRAVREERLSEVQGSDGPMRNHVRESERGLMSIHGLVHVPRLQYGQRETSSLFPADAALNLPVEVYSHGLRRMVGLEIARSSYETTIDLIERYTGGKVPPRQVQELALRAAADFDLFYAGRSVLVPEETDDLLVLSVDGKGVVVRTECLREETRAKAESAAEAQSALDKHSQGGERVYRRRTGTVAAVYGVAPFVRTPEEVMAELLREGEKDEKKARPRPQKKRVFASVEKEAKAVIRELFDEAERRDPEHRRIWVCLVDGDKAQIRRVRKEAVRRGVTVIMVLDLIHVLGYLWKAAWCFHEKGDRAGVQEWVKERALKILSGGASHVAAGIRRSATLRGLSRSARKAADTCAGYLLGHSGMVRYDHYLAHGLPIASGVIEGTCRHLVADRMEITGARWGLPGAEAVLRLRAVQLSGDFDEYWSFHLAREYERNHAALYARKPGQVAA